MSLLEDTESQEMMRLPVPCSHMTLLERIVFCRIVVTDDTLFRLYSYSKGGRKSELVVESGCKVVGCRFLDITQVQ